MKIKNEVNSKVNSKVKSKVKSKDKSIGQKIRNFTLTIAICCSLAVAIVGVVCVSVVNAQSQKIYKENLVPLTPVYKVQGDLQGIHSKLKSMTLEAATGINTGTDYISQINTRLNDISNGLNQYKKSISSEKDESNYAATIADFNEYKNSISGIESSVQSGQVKQAAAAILKNVSLIDDFEAKISNDFADKTAQAAQSNQIATVIFVGAVILMLGLSAAFVLMSAKLSKRVSNKITQPIYRMVAAAESIADGNLNADIEVNSSDETGVLADALRKIVASLNLLKTDVNNLIGEAIEGRLDTRADISKHKGDYKVIISGVNTMFDTIKEPLDVASGFIDRLAEAEHQDAIENTYKGYYAVLIDNLNKVRTSILVLETEADKLAQAGLDGELDVRGDETRLKGIYLKIIKGFNVTFDAIKKPLDVASGFIAVMADGGYQNDIENTYKGYYSTLINNLNHAKQSLHLLADESMKLKNAGMEGDLSVRADASKLKGSYADIIIGFNETLDSVTAALDESNIVLGKMAVNDYTLEMSDGYKGRLKEFAEAINSVHKRLMGVQDAFVKVSLGDTSLLEKYKNTKARSENDHQLPAVLASIQAVKDLTDQSNDLAEAALSGNLSVRGDADNFKGGYRHIIQGMNKTMEAFERPLEEASQVLQNLAQGDLTSKMTGSYQGKYNEIKMAINRVVDSFNKVMSELDVAASQVSAGSKQVSDASQSLSQGAAEQASSVEELTSSITEVAAQTKQNAVSATQASELSADAQEEAALGTAKMNQMLESMQEINESSANISKIIKVIDDIAFQTNILALNAAVEAARAGQYGKGFAVVAEEVRNLAAKSASAAKDTTALIEGSISKVESGTKIANETAEMLGQISESVKKTTEIVKNIAAASNEQATAVAQIDQGISQVSTVVQTNSSTAEESAASSEELSGQANMLKQMVERFKLKNNGEADNMLEAAAAGPYQRTRVIEDADPAGEYGKY